MQISKFTDYSFRTLIFMAQNRNINHTVDGLSKSLNISEHHLKKIIYLLAKTGIIVSYRGRRGGLKLGLEPQDINLGQVFSYTENTLNVVECVNDDEKCTFMKNGCKLKPIILNSLDKFVRELDNYTLKDLL